MRHFCTLFNSFYQFHARALYESICAHDDIENLQFYFFCFDSDSLDYIKGLNLKRVHAISLDELEAHLPELKKVKPQRSFVEYFFTSTPGVCKYVMENYPDVNEVVYLDADLFFFQSTEIIFKEVGASSISIIPHRFSPINYYKNIYGFYNVGWISFKRDEEGMACLNQWYSNTIEWCYDKLTLHRYADQKYLDSWKKDYKNICIIKNKGANIAPWNVGNYRIHLKNGILHADEDPLVFYHFASLKLIEGSYYTTISSYFASVTTEIKELIYRPYILRLYELGFAPRASIRQNKNPVVARLRKMIRSFYKDEVVVEK